MAGLVPEIIVLALGAGALGFPDALRLLLQDAGRSPLLDIATCVLVLAVLTAHALGAMLLARFVRKPRRRRGAAPAAADPFAQTTLVVSLGAALAVFACLSVATAASGGPDVARQSLLLLATVLAGAATVAGTALLTRFSRTAGNASAAAGGGGAAPEPPAADVCLLGVPATTGGREHDGAASDVCLLGVPATTVALAPPGCEHDGDEYPSAA